MPEGPCGCNGRKPPLKPVNGSPREAFTLPPPLTELLGQAPQVLLALLGEGLQEPPRLLQLIELQSQGLRAKIDPKITKSQLG